MSITTVQSQLLSAEDRERVNETLGRFETSEDLPEAVKEPVLRLLRLVAEGRGAYVVPSEDSLTTTKAAELLGVSRPFLTRLLEEGRIPFHKTGSDRRIAASDIIEYLRRRDEAKSEYADAAASYGDRRNERLAAISGVSKKEATDLGFG